MNGKTAINVKGNRSLHRTQISFQEIHMMTPKN